MKIMISYCHNDKKVVQRLIEDLKELNHDVWYDQKLTGGIPWWKTILKEIRKCDLFIFALSQESLKSEPCKLEYQYAYKLNKNILPIKVSNNVSINSAPIELTKIQYIEYLDYDNSKTILKLVNSLRNLPDISNIPEPLPGEPELPTDVWFSIKEQIKTPKDLNIKQQSDLILKIKIYLRNNEFSKDIKESLEYFKSRSDICNSIYKEIELIFSNNINIKHKTDRNYKNIHETKKDWIVKLKPDTKKKIFLGFILASVFGIIHGLPLILFNTQVPKIETIMMCLMTSFAFPGIAAVSIIFITKGDITRIKFSIKVSMIFWVLTFLIGFFYISGENYNNSMSSATAESDFFALSAIAGFFVMPGGLILGSIISRIFYKEIKKQPKEL